MDEILALTMWQLAAAYVLIIFVFIVLRWRKIPKQKLLVLATLRMSIQLVLIGYILIILFDQQNPWITLIIIAIMQVFSIITILSKFKHDISNALKKVVIITFPIATLVVLFYFLLAVVQVAPWYDAQYFIPIAGMIVGNSLTGVTLALSQMNTQMKEHHIKVEEALILGATIKEATKSLIDRSFQEAIVPTLNTMLGMGIVFLPGMMTGQILSGVSPLTAIRYQIAIMLGILATVSLSVLLMLLFGIKTYFNKDAQIIDAYIKNNKSI